MDRTGKHRQLRTPAHAKALSLKGSDPSAPADTQTPIAPIRMLLVHR
jgi:hypothetical protein